jgi:hypothetical protein
VSCSSRLVLGIDLAYIHPGYNNDAVPEYYDNARCRSLYQSDCAFGDTRYCNDGEDVSGRDLSAFDVAFIRTSCGSEVH